MKDVMLDLETLGTKHDAAIIQIGACYFDRKTGEIGRGFSVNVDPGPERFSMDYAAIKWWFEQSDKARNMVMENPVTLEVALDGLKSFLWESDLTVWSHATFDMPILNNAFETLGKKNPIAFRNMRDIRTVMDIYGEKVEIEREGTHHHALDDAKYQARYVSIALQRITCDHMYHAGVCGCGKVYGAA